MAETLTNELERRVDEVLFYIWDPLGFNAEPYARAEYRDYVQEVLNYMQNDKSSDEIANLLIDIVENRIGIKFNHEISDNVSKLLCKHKKALESGVN